SAPTVTTQYEQTIREHRATMNAEQTPSPYDLQPEDLFYLPREDYKKEADNDRRQRERDAYGTLKSRKERAAKALAHAKRRSSGTAAINPFLGQAIKHAPSKRAPPSPKPEKPKSQTPYFVSDLSSDDAAAFNAMSFDEAPTMTQRQALERKWKIEREA